MHEISLCMEHRANTWPGSSRDAGRSGGGQGGDCSFRLRSGRKGNQEFSTRSLFTEDGTGKQETTFFFNDGFGRLTEFHEYTEGARMFLIIRQNMNVVWQGSCRVTDHRFSVYRRESNGRVYFRYAWVNMSISLKSAVMTGGPLRKAVFPFPRIP